MGSGYATGVLARTGSGVCTPLRAHLVWNGGLGQHTNRTGGGAPPLSRNHFCANGCAQRVRRGVGEVRVHVRMGGGARPPFLCPQSRTNCGGTRLGGGCEKGRRGRTGMGRGTPPLALCACPCLCEVGAACKPAPPRPGFHAGRQANGGGGTRNEAPAPRLLQGVSPPIDLAKIKCSM